MTSQAHPRARAFLSALIALSLASVPAACSDGDNGVGGDAGDNGDGGEFPPDGGTTITVCATAVEARGPHTCALDEEGDVMCWGRNHRGQLGTGSTGPAAPPRLVDLPDEAIEVRTGIAHSCALLRDGRVLCWGYGEVGSLGDGGGADRSTPVAVQGISDAVALFSGGFHACALRGGGELRCWGDNTAGQIGDGSAGEGADRMTPVTVASSVQTAALGEEHTCLVTTGGAVECWGRNEAGQLGDGTRTDRPLRAPALRDGVPLSGATSIAAGAYHTCAVVGGGEVVCWGMNDRGQMGNGSQGTDQLQAVLVSGVSGPLAMAAGVFHTCSLGGGGEVLCWGDNRVGQLGTDDAQSRSTPTRVSGLEPASDIAAGDIHSCAVAGGDVLCWGYNTDGQLGVTPGNPIHRPVLALACQ
jgi:alpha-tubulin suppressor-like RCC1 family protein